MCEVQDARHSLSAWQATTCNTHHHCSWNLSLTVPVPLNVVRFTLRLWLLAVLLCYFCVYVVFLFRIILAYKCMCVCTFFGSSFSQMFSFWNFSSVSYFVFHNKIYTQSLSRYGHFLVLTLFAIRNWSSHGVRESASRSMLHINIDFLVIMFSDRSIQSYKMLGMHPSRQISCWNHQAFVTITLTIHTLGENEKKLAMKKKTHKDHSEYTGRKIKIHAVTDIRARTYTLKIRSFKHILLFHECQSREEPLQKEISTHNMLQTPIKRSIAKRGQCDCWKTEKKEFLWETITNVQMYQTNKFYSKNHSPLSALPHLFQYYRLCIHI